MPCIRFDPQGDAVGGPGAFVERNRLLICTAGARRGHEGILGSRHQQQGPGRQKLADSGGIYGFQPGITAAECFPSRGVGSRGAAQFAGKGQPGKTTRQEPEAKISSQLSCPATETTTPTRASRAESSSASIPPIDNPSMPTRPRAASGLVPM